MTAMPPLPAALKRREGYQVESRLMGVARGLGFTLGDLDRDISGFSGGEKTRARLAGLEVTEKRDYDQGKGWDLAANKEFKLDLPRSRVLHYTLADGSWFAVRPSGTEPKVKFYLSVTAPAAAEADQKLARLREAVLNQT